MLAENSQMSHRIYHTQSDGILLNRNFFNNLPEESQKIFGDENFEKFERMGKEPPNLVYSRKLVYHFYVNTEISVFWL